MRQKKLAVIGNGMGTCRLLDELVQRGGHEQYAITVYGDERGGAYNRILLGRVLAGEDAANIVTKAPEWYARHGIRLVDGTRVARLDTSQRSVETEDGDRNPYDLAVLATGSVPQVPPLQGMTTADGTLRPGVFVYRTVTDCLRLRDSAQPGDGAVVLGGGLLGLEAAKVLADRGLHVTVVHVARTLMNAQLDAIGGEMLCRLIEQCGIFVRPGRTIEAVRGDRTVDGVVFDDGSIFPAELVVLACGTRPRIDLARAAGLPVNKGIVVNDTLATEVPGVYAFGECAEHQGTTYGMVAPVWEQAAVLGNVLTGGQTRARYRGSKLYARLKVAGIDVASMGIVEPELESDQVFKVIEERRSAYRKLIVRDGHLVGATLVGNTGAAASLVQLFDRGDPLPDDPLEALCPGLGSNASVSRVICSCHKVSDQALREAMANGATSVADLAVATRAGTGCGSCKSDLAQLLVTHGAKAASPRSALVH